MTFEPDYPANKPEEVNPRWFNYANIDGRTATDTYVLSTDFAKVGDVSCFTFKFIPVELVV